VLLKIQYVEIVELGYEMIFLDDRPNHLWCWAILQEWVALAGKKSVELNIFHQMYKYRCSLFTWLHQRSNDVEGCLDFGSRFRSIRWLNNWFIVDLSRLTKIPTTYLYESCNCQQNLAYSCFGIFFSVRCNSEVLRVQFDHDWFFSFNVFFFVLSCGNEYYNYKMINNIKIQSHLIADSAFVFDKIYTKPYKKPSYNINFRSWFNRFYDSKRVFINTLVKIIRLRQRHLS
jgi:hypothetical protein